MEDPLKTPPENEDEALGAQAESSSFSKNPNSDPRVARFMKALELHAEFGSRSAPQQLDSHAAFEPLSEEPKLAQAQFDSSIAEPELDPQVEFERFIAQRKPPANALTKVKVSLIQQFTGLAAITFMAVWGWRGAEQLSVAIVGHHTWLHLIAFASVQGLAITLATMFAASFERDERGSRRTIGYLFGASIFVFIFTSIANCLVGGVIFSSIAWFPNWWWLSLFVCGFLTSGGWSQMISRLMKNDTRAPHEDETWLQAQLDVFLQGTRFEGAPVRIQDSHVPSIDNNVRISGLFGQKTVTVGASILKWFTREELSVILAHEVGHAVLWHHLKRLVASITTALVGYYLTSTLLMDILPYTGHASLNEVSTLPLIMIILTVVFTVTQQVTLFVSRTTERSADRYALEKTRDPKSYKKAFEKLELLGMNGVKMPAWLQILMTHPSTAKRLAMADRFEREHSKS